MKKILLGLSISVAALLMSGCAGEETSTAHEGHKAHWAYDGEHSPEHWDEFSATCGEGHAQSPINIVSGSAIELNAQDIIHLDEDVHANALVIDNGHSIKVTPDKPGKVMFQGQEFDLLQFHFHGKSEHTIDGKRYDLVAHMVHQNPKTKQLLVVAVLFEEGKANPVIEKVVHNIGSKIKVDPRDLLPTDSTHYYHYIGSLTTPPCSENVEWYIFKKPVTASKEQIEAMRHYYVGNERPVQELHNRVIEAN